MSFTRTADNRKAAPVRAVRPVQPSSLADATEEPAPDAPEKAPQELVRPLDLPIILASCHRAALPGASEIAAARDPAFRALVAEGDLHRDARHWHSAEMAYTAALACFPYQSGYWVQQGHMRKEQGHDFEAEISYRTAIALGVSPEGVIEHLRFVMARQGVSEVRYPIRYGSFGATAGFAPSEPDVLLLAGLLWRVPGLPNEDILPLLRENANLDELFAAMAADPRFARANVDWLSCLRDEDLAS